MQLEIELYTHFFRIVPTHVAARQLCVRHASTLVQWMFQQQGRQTVRVPARTFAASNKDRSEFRFHRNQLDEFIQLANNLGVRKEDIVIREMSFLPAFPTEVHHVVREGWEPREIQLPAIEYLHDKTIRPNQLITLGTGTGKSFISMWYASQVQQRIMYIIRPAFIDKWIVDLHKTYDIPEDEVVAVQGSGQLMAMLAHASNMQNLPKVLILSNRTYQNYLKTYEEYGEEMLDLGYDCLPQDMFAHCGIGIRYIDEVHLDFHLNFKADMYANIPQAAAFSASLVDEDPFIVKMYNIAYPGVKRYNAPPPKKYIESRGVLYKLRDHLKPSTNWPGRKEYNHGAFEKWIIKNKDVLRNYKLMLEDIIDEEYIANYRDGDRCLVFCYSINMATILTDFLKEAYPNKTVERYVEDDEFANVMDPDIRVSTVLSAGTGIDIAKLRVCIMTTAISSEKSNIQGIGRLRELHGDERPPVFYWLTCESIKKHMAYHLKKKELFKRLAKSVGDRYYHRRV